MVRNGIDRPDVWTPLLSGQRVGLLTNAAGLDHQLRRDVDTLLAAGIQVTALFAPEHGLYGLADAGETVGSQIDPHTGLPVYSLYQEDSRRFTRQMLDAVDILAVDLPLIGVRFFTYLTALVYALESCAEFHKPLLLLDRCNPLDGLQVEGGPLLTGYESYVGGYPLPIRYGLTAGEVAAMVNAERKLGCHLIRVGVSGWRRDMLFPETSLPWLAPSPSLQHFENTLFYPGMALLEGTNVSEGRGTADPFLMIGAPWVQADCLVDALNERALPGVRFAPVSFTPACSKHAGNGCHGVKALLTDANALHPVSVGVALLDTIRALWPDEFRFLPTETEDHALMIDLLSGSDTLRTHPTGERYLAEADRYCNAYRDRIQSYLNDGGISK